MSKRDEPERTLKDHHRLLLAACADGRLCRGDLAVLSVILRHCFDGQATSYPGIDEIVKHGRVSRATVFRNVEHLEETGWITVDRSRKVKASNVYRPAWERAKGRINATVSPMRPLRGRRVSSKAAKGLIGEIEPVSSTRPDVALDVASEAAKQKLCARAQEEQQQPEPALLDIPALRAEYLFHLEHNPKRARGMEGIAQFHPHLVDLIPKPSEAA
jgi:hypothetical protein